MVAGLALGTPSLAGAIDEADELAQVTVTRYGGADRYATSLLAAQAIAANAGGSLDAVVFVSGRSWAEAVVAASIAGRLEAPVLMTPPSELRADAREFLAGVGATTAVLVASGADDGRTIDTSVGSALEAAGLAVEWIGGADQYETGVAAARRAGSAGTLGDYGSTAIIASGEVFADALVAGPLSARAGLPVLLSPRAELDSGVESYLSDADIRHVVLMGGTAALSPAVEDAVRDLGIAVNRMAGATRFDTAVKTAVFMEQQFSGQCFIGTHVGLARARVPFDSFSAAPLLARLCAPLVLTNPDKIAAETATYLNAVRATNTTGGSRLTVFGGDAAVSQAAIDAYLADNSDDAEKEPQVDDAPKVLPAGACGGSDQLGDVLFVGPTTSMGSPTWSPDCDRIAYIEQSVIWTARPDGSNRRQILRRSAGGFFDDLSWSPDGDRITYARKHHSQGAGTSHIYVVNVDDGSETQLTEGDVFDDSPSWSPDGSRIVFVREVGRERLESGGILGGQHSIMTMQARKGSEPSAVLAPPYGTFDSVRWSPDGEFFAYARSGSLRVARADGTDERELATGIVHQGLSWSPDGSRIAFVRGLHRAENHMSDIYTIDVQTLRTVRITDRSWPSIEPAWSRDGERIAYVTYRLDGSRLRDLQIRIAPAKGLDQ